MTTRKRAILIVPANNTTMEKEVRVYCPEISDWTVARIPRPPRPLTPEDLPAYRASTLAAVEPYAQDGADVVLYGCTAAGFLAGPKGDTEAVSSLASLTRAPVVSTAVAMGVALRHSGLRRVDLVSPYIDWKNEMLISFLAAAGVSVAGCDSFRAQNPTELGSITGEMVLQKCLDVARPESEGLFIACVQLPTIEAIPVLAAKLKRPVWSAVRAAAWATLVALGLTAERLVPARSKSPQGAGENGYDVILIGKPTDSSGVGGVTFASESLREEDEITNRGAVQIPDPFLKNVLFKANADLFELVRKGGINIGFKDLGGGGFTCATSEIGAASGYGMELDLDLMHKAADFPPEVLAIAETQERFLLIAPKGLRSKILKIYNEDWDLPNVYEGARASVVGQVNMTEPFVVKHKEKIVCNVPINHLTGGIKYQRIEKKRQLDLLEPDFEMPMDMNQVILKILRSPKHFRRSES